MQDREVQELGQKLRNALRCTQRDERERGESLILTREGPEQGRRNGERGEQIRDVCAGPSFPAGGCSREGGMIKALGSVPRAT